MNKVTWSRVKGWLSKARGKPVCHPYSPPRREGVATATFGMGCFWEPQRKFAELNGVYNTRVGYCGGSTLNPHYGKLGDHTEVVQVDYDSRYLSYNDLLKVFWENHRSANHVRQYRSAIFTHREFPEQATAAVQFLERQRDVRNGDVHTDVEKLDVFYLAEQYHQHYLRKARGY